MWGTNDRPFVLFVPAVAFAAWYGRLPAALITIGLSAISADLFFAEPRLTFYHADFKQWSLFLIFVVASVVIAYLIEKMHLVTDRAVEEAEQRRKSEDALRESERLLRIARDEALAVSAAKDKFLAVLSHELRTPLSPVLLLASEHAKDSSLPPSIRAAFQTIAENANMEADLIDDLLDVSRIIHGKFTVNRTPADLHPILLDSIDTLSADVRSKRLNVTHALHAKPSSGLIDAVRMKQVFTNLLKNAVKFTPEGGSIHVSSELSTGGRAVAISIVDSGIGLTADEITRVFLPFVQANHPDGAQHHTTGGLGLGLAICKQIVESHGGSIWAESLGPGSGARFCLRIPLNDGKGERS